MKTYIFSLVLVCSISMQAQPTLDTIYANNKKNVALFFPEPIRQGITGAKNFVFTYNREKEQYFGLLQATPGKESNLLTLTKNGQVYSYILKYKEELTKLNYFITPRSSIGNEKPKLEIQKPIVQPQKDHFKRVAYFKKISKHLINTKFSSIATRRKKGVKLRLNTIVYNSSEVYLVIEIKNKSGIDFEVDYLHVYQINGDKKRKASYQKLLFDVIYKYQIPSIIKNDESKRLVYVLPKFVPGGNEQLNIELKELNGNRSIVLKRR